MKIRTEHQNLGAALMQIAEHDSFTAINPWKVGNIRINNAFLINTDTCVFLKYGNEPKRNTEEYQFTYTADHLESIRQASQVMHKVFVALVCVEDQEICCLSLDEFNSLIEARRASHGAAEDSYQVLVTVPEGKSLRAYTNASGRRGVVAGREQVVSRSKFPACLF
ncbi:hypothetical protein NJC38_02560 [Pseudomonas sp. 21LCFQ010]|uniref:hypothetical protein n=1 Tax=Pseudomonas sp. 21LCFQ010 TaxID=2957506 RepID=UPI0020982E54|nr:hypothetical protein [Pseudomonas sp. 21LCFQ010]MCO8161032.1 hypothetical protein [Pseudomonas sp. 21LCFQ010]